MKAGRPSKYKAEFAKQAAKLCRLGATDVELASFFNVSINTIDNWKARHPEFMGSLRAEFARRARQEPDAFGEKMPRAAERYVFI